MRLFVDTNVFASAVTDEPETAAVAAEVLDGDHDFLTSTMNLMELRAVLTRKHKFERSRADDVQQEIAADVSVVIPDASDMVEANSIQREELLYPIDALLPAVANGHDAELVSFDGELQEAGAIDPGSIVSS